MQYISTLRNGTPVESFSEAENAEFSRQDNSFSSLSEENSRENANEIPSKPGEETLEGTKVQAEASDGRIDLNTADSEELQTLKGIGPAKAQAIIDYRTRYGGFTCIEEITEVKGIGPKTLEKLRDHICVSEPSF